MFQPQAPVPGLALLVLGLALGACRGETPGGARAEPAPEAERVTIGAVRWFVDYDAALAVARAQDKALWVHFGENPG